MKRTVYPLLFLALVLVQSCGDDDDPTVPTIVYGYDYYPDSLGLTRIYDVDSLVLRENSSRTDTFNYQIKVVYKEDYTDNEGERNVKVERYYRPNDTTDWTFDKVYITKRTKTEAQEFYNNVRELKLAFPVRVGSMWDGNRYNNNDEQVYEITKLEETAKPFIVPTDVITILQKDEKNFIEKKYDLEKYARGVGMIFKEHIDIETQTNDTFGVIYHYNLKEFSY